MDFFKEMLNRYADGERINEEDSKLLGELIERHHDDAKIGAGIAYFYKDSSPDHPTSSFHVMQIDGIWTDFSYPTCVKGETPNAQYYFYRACRSAVSPYLTREKNDLFENGSALCSKTGQLVTKDSSNYRHTSPSFKELVDRFTNENSIQIDWNLFSPDRNKQYSVRFLDSALERKFISFHKMNANLALFKKGIC